MFWCRSTADPSLPHCTSTVKGNGNASRLGLGIATPARYPALRGVSRIASSGSTYALRLTNLKLWMAPATELVRTRERSCRATGNHLVQVVGHVRLCRLTRVNAAIQSPFRPESPLPKVLAECPNCGPRQRCGECGKFRCWLCVKSVTNLDASPRSVSTRYSQWFCASLRLCSSHDSEFPHRVLSVVFRETNWRVESKGGA